MGKTSARIRLFHYLFLLHFIVVQLFFYYHYLKKWLLTENTAAFLRKVLQ
ncbi:MAG: hypothetical protein JW863_09600 [Chitinispirillaceae bacterium]|nr:hypothetical protein [Chitinispirillaceae bacterium]